MGGVSHCRSITKLYIHISSALTLPHIPANIYCSDGRKKKQRQRSIRVLLYAVNLLYFNYSAIAQFRDRQKTFRKSDDLWHLQRACGSNETLLKPRIHRFPRVSRVHCRCKNIPSIAVTLSRRAFNWTRWKQHRTIYLIAIYYPLSHYCSLPIVKPVAWNMPVKGAPQLAEIVRAKGFITL